MGFRWRESSEIWLRYGASILILVVCFVIEWNILDRIAVNAYEIRYQKNLEEFRQNPEEYIRFHRISEDYQSTGDSV